MTTQDLIAIGGMLIGLVGLITGFILQRDTKKIRELERENQKYKGRLIKALNAIKGYQAIEIEHAEKEGVDVKAYRAKIRKEKQELFNSSFLSPSKVDEMMKDLENN
jgi:hypothetical protein